MKIGGVLELFSYLGYNCSQDSPYSKWNVTHAPYYDTDLQECVGYENMPEFIDCTARASFVSQVRLCKCIKEGKGDLFLKLCLYDKNLSADSLGRCFYWLAKDCNFCEPIGTFSRANPLLLCLVFLDVYIKNTKLVGLSVV